MGKQRKKKCRGTTGEKERKKGERIGVGVDSGIGRQTDRLRDTDNKPLVHNG